MKRLILLTTLLLLIVGGCENPVDREVIPVPEESLNTELAAPLEIPDGENGDIIPGEYIVVFKPDHAGNPTKKAQDILKEMEMTLPDAVRFVYTNTIQGFAGKIPEGKLNALKNHPSVDYVEPDRIIKITPQIAEVALNDITVSGEIIPWGIQRVNGGVTYSGSGKIWILDTGIEPHADLNIDRAAGETFITGEDNNFDGHGHGTHVAGTAAAIDNDAYVIGVAAGATVIPVKVLSSSGSGSYSGVIAGIEHVGTNGAVGDVANMSLGGGRSTSIDNAVKAAADKGIKFSLAAGNDARKASLSSPARVEHPNVYTISAMDNSDRLASFSNFGNPPVDYAQPGVAVRSLSNTGGVSGAWNGTSMAAPHMAGLLLLDSYKTDGYLVADRDRDPDPIAVYDDGSGITNQVPTASFEATITDFTVDFDATGSSDPDGDNLTYSWDFGGAGTAVNPTTAIPSFTYDAAETYTVTLTVNDGNGGIDVTSLDVTVPASEEPTGDIIFEGTLITRGRTRINLTWQNVVGTNVTITRSDLGSPIVTANDGAYSDKNGISTSGTPYTYTIKGDGPETKTIIVE